RMKNVHETAKIPVLLTIGKMELSAFKPEESNRVKADGLIVKPFEASDLLTAVQKLEAQTSPKKPLPTAFESEDETPEYEKTVKIAVRESRDASYAEWKSTAEEHSEEHTTTSTKRPTTEIPAEMAAAPAFMDVHEDESLRATQLIDQRATVAA